MNAYEEAGIRGEVTAQTLGHYGYNKRLRSGAKMRFRVDVFAMEVTEVLDLWPEAHERARQWLSPAEAAIRVDEPELAVLIRTFAGDRLGQALPAPTGFQAIWLKLKTLLRLLGIDHERLTFKFQGRRFRLTDVHGHLVQELLA